MFTKLTDADYEATFAATEGGMCIFFKKLCPHCLNMEKALAKMALRVPGVTLLSIDSEESPKAREACNAERAPTMVVIKNGKVVATRGGLMNPKEAAEFYQNA